MTEWALIYMIAFPPKWGDLKRVDGFKTHESCEATKEMILTSFPHSRAVCVVAKGAVPYWGMEDKR